MPSKSRTQYVNKSGRPQTPQDWKRSIRIPIPKKGVLKNVQTIGQLTSSPMLVRSCLKSSMLGFSIMWTKNFQMSKLGLEKTEEPEIKLPTFAGIIEKARGFQKKTSTSVSLTMLKLLTVWIIPNYGKFLKRWEYQTILLVSWESCMQAKKQQLEPCMEQLVQDWGLVQDWERSMTGLSAVTLFI